MRYTFADFKKEYPDDDACLEAVFQNQDVKCCPKCAVVTAKFYRVRKRKCYACSECGHHIYPLANTVFRKSETPLWNWFYGIYLFSVAKNGVSAKELQRHLGVTYKTAWRMCKQIRLLMAEDIESLKGAIEIDETYIGGKHRSSNRYAKKSVVFGMVERDGSVKAKHVKTNGARVLLPEIRKGITPEALIYSDEYRGYLSLKKMGYGHKTVNHRRKEYGRGDIYTNTIEGFWGQMKRSIDGTYHHVSAKYLQHYVNEFVFRYNYRSMAVCPVLFARAAMPV